MNAYLATLGGALGAQQRLAESDLRIAIVQQNMQLSDLRAQQHLRHFAALMRPKPERCAYCHSKHTEAINCCNCGAPK